jgi:hypothetical protein
MDEKTVEVRRWLEAQGLDRDDEYVRCVVSHIRYWREQEAPPPMPAHGPAGECEACDARRVLRGEA